MTAGLITCDTLAVFDQNGFQDQMPVELPVEIPIDTQIVERHNVLLDTQNIIDATCRLDGLATNSDIRMSFYAEGGYHYIFVIKTGSSSAYIARIARICHEDWSQEWLHSKMSGEQALMAYLKRVSPTFPVPAVFEFNSITGNTEGTVVQLPFLIMEKATGIELAAVYSCLNMDQKIDLTRKLARVMGDIFNITAPTPGSVISVTQENTLLLGPPVESRRGRWPEISIKPLSLNELAISHIKQLRNICSATATATLDILDSVRRRTCDERTEETYHLIHPDMRMPNVFVRGSSNDVEVTSIIDWDLHTFLPAALAAEYPMWLRFHGFYNPKYNPRGGQTEYWWEEDFDTILKLQGEFQKAIRKSHASFYHHLTCGIAQRELFYWFYCWEENQSYFDAINAWSKNYI